MNLSQLAAACDAQLITNDGFDDREIKGCYIGDLLSWVMGRASEGNVWITIMSNVNIVAVAALTDCACILLAEGVVPEESVIEKANSQDITIFSSSKTAYELACLLSDL